MAQKILIVDDEPNIGEVILGYLEDIPDIEATYTPYSPKALSMIKENHYDLVITDLLMPEINGIELTEFIFENYPKTKVLACSGGGDSGALVAGMALDQALTEGAHNALMKPFTKEELVSKVKDLLSS